MNEDLTEEKSSVAETPLVYTVVRETWLSRSPNAWARVITAASLLALVLGCSLYWSGFQGARQWMPATPADVFEKKELWRLWTTLFAHSDMKHLVANSFMFYILGFFLNGYFGSRVFPWGALLMGGVINWFALKTYAPTTQLIGMSGVVFWMGGTWLVLYGFLDTKRTHLNRALRSIGVALALFFPSEAFQPQISYRTHAIGFLIGIISGLAIYLWRRKEFKSAEVVETVVD